MLRDKEEMSGTPKPNKLTIPLKKDFNYFSVKNR
jgi:hypothetical protein